MLMAGPGSRRPLASCILAPPFEPNRGAVRGFLCLEREKSKGSPCLLRATSWEVFATYWLLAGRGRAEWGHLLAARHFLGTIHEKLAPIGTRSGRVGPLARCAPRPLGRGRGACKLRVVLAPQFGPSREAAGNEKTQLLMLISFVTENYPSRAEPYDGTFVQQLVWAMARQGHACEVFCPVSQRALRRGVPVGTSIERADDHLSIQVFRFPYLSFSSKNLLITHTGRWTTRSFAMAARLAMSKRQTRPDLIYGHFLYSSGFTAIKMAQKFGCPAIIGVGESSPWSIAAFGQRVARAHFARQGHFLANSTRNRNMLIELLNIAPERILMEPNGVDQRLMRPRDREHMRRKHGIAPDAFVVAFVGANIERKGPMRVLSALEGLEDAKCLMLGKGTEALRSHRIIRSGAVSHESIPELLSCANVFALPTTGEGSCNAVLEAMACGLPIVTSNGSHMDDIVDDTVAFRVDAMSVPEIRNALRLLKEDDSLRETMAAASLCRAKRFDIEVRASRIANWAVSLSHSPYR